MTTKSYPILDRDACQGCGGEIEQVDLYGTPFFTHKPRQDCLTWWHVDHGRNLTHQARRSYGVPQSWHKTITHKET